MVDYKKRFVEIDEILNYLSFENLLKIPEEILQVIEENKDPNYTWKYDETKPLKNQDVNKDTIAFLSYLNLEYLLNSEQKELMKQIHKNNEKKLEKQKRKIYNPDNLFKQNEKHTKNNTSVQETSLIEINHTGLFKRAWRWICKILNQFFNKN